MEAKYISNCTINTLKSLLDEDASIKYGVYNIVYETVYGTLHNVGILNYSRDKTSFSYNKDFNGDISYLVLKLLNKNFFLVEKKDQYFYIDYNPDKKEYQVLKANFGDDEEKDKQRAAMNNVFPLSDFPAKEDVIKFFNDAVFNQLTNILSTSK